MNIQGLNFKVLRLFDLRSKENHFLGFEFNNMFFIVCPHSMHSLNKLKKYHRGIIKNSVLWAFYGHYSNLAGISKKNWRRMHQRALKSNTSILQNITRYRKELQIMNKSRV